MPRSSRRKAHWSARQCKTVGLVEPGKTIEHKCVSNTAMCSRSSPLLRFAGMMASTKETLFTEGAAGGGGVAGWVAVGEAGASGWLRGGAWFVIADI